MAADPVPEPEVYAVVDPREIALWLAPPEGSAMNSLRGVVDEIQPGPPSGDRLRVSLATRPPVVAELTWAAPEKLGLAPGVQVFATFKATGVRVFP